MGSEERGVSVSVPVGFRFRPREEELVDYYLKRKMEDKNTDDSDIVPEINVCKYDPWDLPALLPTEPDSPYHDMEWFFTSPRDYKYANSTRSNRATPNGKWSITGKERMIKARRSKAVIGTMRTMTFYKRYEPKAVIGTKRTKNFKKTNWVMHQYSRTESLNAKSVQRDFVLYRLKHNSDKDTTICDRGEPSGSSVSNHEEHAAANVTPEEYYSCSSLQSPTNRVLEVVLQANGINDDCAEVQSRFGDNNHSVTNTNDISTCDEGELHSFTTNDECLKRQPPDGDLKLLFRPPQLEDNILSPNMSTSMGDVLHKLSTIYDDEQVRNTASNIENQAIDEHILEVYSQPVANLEALFHTPERQEYTLPPLRDTEAGDVLHDNNYIECYESDSPIWSL